VRGYRGNHRAIDWPGERLARGLGIMAGQNCHRPCSTIETLVRSFSLASPNQKVNRLASRIFRKIQILRPKSETLGRDLLDPLYRLGRLLERNDAKAIQLVTDTYETAARSDHLSDEDPEQLRMHLFEALYSAFEQGAIAICGACRMDSRNPNAGCLSHFSTTRREHRSNVGAPL